MRTKPCLHRLSKGNTNTGSLETGKAHLRETICGISITPQSMGRGKRLRCAPANSPITRGRGVRKPIDMLLWPLALGAWTYATGSPTPKGLGSCSERPAALLSIGVSTPQDGAYPSHLHHRSYPMPMAISPFNGRRRLPHCDCCAFSASHHSGLFLPQRDPENHVR